MSHPCPEVAGGPGHKLISISGKKHIVLPRHLSAQVAPGMEQMAEDPGKGSPGKSEDGLSSVQFSHSVMSDSLWPHGLQHARLPCPSPTPRVYSNSCPSSRQCHPTVSSSIIPFSSCLQSFPASGSLPISQLFASGGQSIGVSASTSVLPKYIQDWFLLRWTGGSPCSPGTLKSLLQHHSSKASGLQCSAFFTVQLSHPYMTTGRTVQKRASWPR